MNEAETASKPQVYCVCSHVMDRHDEFTDRCPDCPCTRPRPEARPRRLL